MHANGHECTMISPGCYLLIKLIPFTDSLSSACHVLASGISDMAKTKPRLVFMVHIIT